MAAAKLMAVVVLPTPPFWLTIAMTLLRGVLGAVGFSGVGFSDMAGRDQG
jgi:hypothetical protein